VVFCISLSILYICMGEHACRGFIYFAFGNIYVIWGAQRFYIFARVVYMT
jgi:hypothetical protein